MPSKLLTKAPPTAGAVGPSSEDPSIDRSLPEVVARLESELVGLDAAIALALDELDEEALVRLHSRKLIVPRLLRQAREALSDERAAVLEREAIVLDGRLADLAAEVDRAELAAAVYARHLERARQAYAQVLVRVQHKSNQAAKLRAAAA